MFFSSHRACQWLKTLMMCALVALMAACSSSKTSAPVKKKPSYSVNTSKTTGKSSGSSTSKSSSGTSSSGSSSSSSKSSGGSSSLVGTTQTGQASYYADKFQGRSTASGEPYDKAKLTGAHRTLPFGSVVRVTNKANGKSVEVRINDRGPFKEGRIVDLSRAAAAKIDLITAGVADVSMTIVSVP